MPEKHGAKPAEKSEFNLIYEPWIKVFTKDHQVKEVSLMDLILHAHEYISLAGDMGTQDMAIMRVVLAVLKTVFSRYDLDGTPSPLTKKNVFERVEGIVKLGRFPEAPVRKYFDAWHDRFYLFDPEHPFYQIPYVDNGTEYKASKLNGVLMESGNSPRFSSPVNGEARTSMSYAEAARWLITINSYDDAGLKKKHEGKLPSIGTGWLGQICAASCIGSGLFKTLICNLTMLRDGTKMWGLDHPAWEGEPCFQERRKIAIPDNMAALLTVQSRRMFLKRENDRVVGFLTYGGDFFDRENAVMEQMTIWKNQTADETAKEVYTPRKPSYALESWQSIVSFMRDGEGHRMPGVLKWVSALMDRGILPEDEEISVRLVYTSYCSMSAKMDKVFDTTVTFPSSLLSTKGEVWQELIVDEADRCGKRADLVWKFASNLSKAEDLGDSSAKGKKQMAQTLFYGKIDAPFRRFIASADPNQTEEERAAMLEDWNRFADKAAKDVVYDLAKKAGMKAFTGCDVDGRHYSAAESLNIFYADLGRLNGEKQEK